MQINFISSIVFIGAVMVAYFSYWLHLNRKNQSLLDLSRRPDWIEPILEPEKEEFLEENIVDEIISPILPRAKNKPKATREVHLTHDYNVLTLYLMALPNRPFQGYELLQAISGNGFHYGKMRIFHRHENLANSESPILFSLANAIEPGFFSLSEMGSFSCTGLTLFMRLDDKQNLTNHFYLMLDTARQLADDLGAEILDEARTPFNAISEKRYLGRL